MRKGRFGAAVGAVVDVAEEPVRIRPIATTAGAAAVIRAHRPEQKPRCPAAVLRSSVVVREQAWLRHGIRHDSRSLR